MDDAVKLRLISSRDEAGNVRTFVFDTAGLKWIAGQSQGYVLEHLGPTEDENQRWFTIASAPSEGEIHISTRVSQSVFKQALNAMKPGDEIQAFGLEGDFVWEGLNYAVLVAGGIGITPFRSILVERDAKEMEINCTLLYFNRDENVPFRAELDSLAQKHPEMRLEVVIGEMITAESILAHAPEAMERLTYISGPETMVEAVGEALRGRGVEVKQDWFPGYDEKNF
jgi:ferredoxin-NADP reductase